MSPRKAGTDGALAAALAAREHRQSAVPAPRGQSRPPPQQFAARARAELGVLTLLAQKIGSRGWNSGAGAPRKQPPHRVLIAPEQSQLKIGCREQGGESRADVTYCVREYRWHQHNQGRSFRKAHV